MSKELECLDRIDKRNYLTEREHKEFLGVVEKALIQTEKDKKKARCWDILVSNRLIWIEDGELKLGREFDCELRFDETDFENKEEFNTLKEGLK